METINLLDQRTHPVLDCNGTLYAIIDKYYLIFKRAHIAKCDIPTGFMYRHYMINDKIYESYWTNSLVEFKQGTQLTLF